MHTCSATRTTQAATEARESGRQGPLYSTHRTLFYKLITELRGLVGTCVCVYVCVC
jgi:hypothetical protein